MYGGSMEQFIKFLTAPTFSGISILGSLVSVWIISRIFPGWVKFSYDIKLEKARRELLRRDKAVHLKVVGVVSSRGRLGRDF